MFRIYLRDPNQKVSDKTNTGDPQAAISAFESLVNRTDLDGQKMLAVLNRDGEPIAHHNFSLRLDGSPLYPENYWRGRIHEIDLRGTRSTHGGPNRGQGAKAADGATGLERKNITIDPARADVLRVLGGGDLSLGIRRAADHIAGCSGICTDTL